MSTIPVRIRHAGWAKAVPLTEWPVADLQSLISTLEEWSVYVEGTYEDAPFGQFVVTEAGAYFELVIGSDE